MIREMYPLYKAWQSDPSVRMIVQAGAGEKAFCAGGDVASLYRAKMDPEADQSITREFFYEEYRLNHLIGNSSKPVVSLLDGIFMGGGVGLSVHGQFRIATERSMFAMPETAIGLFPDVGGSFFLPRLPGALGMYLALTGARIKAADLLYTQSSTHYVPSDRLPELEDRLSQLEAPTEMMPESIGLAIEEVAAIPSEKPSLIPHRAAIDAAFSHDSVDGVIQALKDDGSEWADKQITTLGKMSPTSLMLTHRQVTEGATRDLAACLEMEYRMTQGCMRNHDFFEGVRAVLIDKDHQPKWQPASLDEVSTEAIDEYFAPLDTPEWTPGES